MSEDDRKKRKEQAGEGPDAATLLARRRLLKSGFVAPAVLASFMLSQEALARRESCPPVQCSPSCNPSDNCAPYKKP